MTDEMVDPLCGEPWSEHSRIGDCPRPDDDRWSNRLMFVGFWVVVALMVWAACSGR